MSLRTGLEHVLSSYLHARSEQFAGHAVAVLVRKGLRDAVLDAIGDVGRLIVKGSAGQGTWSRGPWVGVFDPLVTSSAQSGYYPVYLFREDMAGVYLSLNQGMTEAKALYKSDAKTALRARARNYHAMLGRHVGIFSEVQLDLAPSAPTNDTAFYEQGNICATYYPAHSLPTDQILKQHLHEMLDVYRTLLEAEMYSQGEALTEAYDAGDVYTEDGTRFRLHKRIERNAKLVNAVKKAKGHVCEVCRIDFEDRYGEIGRGYIEAHHLKPVASLTGSVIPMDPVDDFAVLCSNCHRMVHRSKWIHDMDQFKREHYDPWVIQTAAQSTE